jgi:hypothetical protein
MGFEQYHEPAAELSEETRTFARMIISVKGILFTDGDIVGAGEEAEEGNKG